MPREPVGLNGQEKTVRAEFAARASKSRAEDEYPSIEIDQEDEARFLRAERRVRVRRISLSKKVALQLRYACIIAIAVTALGCMAWATRDYARHSWRFRIDSSDNVEITGVQNAPYADVRRVARNDLGRNVFFISLDERKQQLEQIPWVESATVMRVLPNLISIHIKERTPVAFVQIGPKISLIDSNGVVMGLPASRQTKYSFPVVRGITETEPLSSRAAAMKLYNRMARELDSGGEDGPRYTRQLSEVDLFDPEDIKVVANEGSGTLLVHLGAQDFLERYKLYLAHVKEWRQQFPNLQSVDLRYEGQIVVNPDALRTGSAPEKQTSATETQKQKQAANPPVQKVAKSSVHAKKTVHRGGAVTRKRQRKHSAAKSTERHT